MRSFQEYLTRKQQEFGEKFDTSDLDKKFIRYWETGQRIEVRFSWGETKRGYVGVTTGWKPVFLLLLKSNSRGSSYTLSSKDTITTFYV